jgi:hypothetical protein
LAARLLPYLAALAVWLGLGVAAFTAAARAALPRRETVIAALLFPGTFAAIIHGHNGLLLAGLIGGGLVLLPTAPVRAGLLFGLATMKPHLALLVPVALVAGRRWRALAAAAVSTAAVAAIATFAFGADVWHAYLGSTAVARWLLESGAVPYAKIGSLFSSIRLLGGPLTLAYLLQATVGLAAATSVAVLWHRDVDGDVQVAALLVATLLVTPYLYDYDLPILGVALAAWTRAATRGGWRPWEKSLLFGTWILPLVMRPLASSWRVGIAPLVLAAALAVLWRRATAGQESSRGSASDLEDGALGEVVEPRA